MTTVTLHESARCPVCGEPVGETPVRCPSCETLHHGECWDWVGTCAIYGCAGGAVLPVEAISATPALPVDGALTVSSTVLQHVREREVAAIAESYASLPPGLAPLWWTWISMLVLLPLAMLVGLFAVLPADLMRILFQALAMQGGKLLLVVFIAVGGAMFFPVTLMGTRWRFLLEEQEVEQALTWAGIVFFRRRLPFRDVLRLEVREGTTGTKLVLIRADGGAVDLSHGIGKRPGGARELQGLARSLQHHTPLHVTTALQLDPVSSMKRLEILRHAVREAGGRSAAVACTTAMVPFVMFLAVMLLLPQPYLWGSMQLAITTAGAVGSLTWLSERGRRYLNTITEPENVWLQLPACLLGLVAFVVILVTGHGFAHLVLGALAGAVVSLIFTALGPPSLSPGSGQGVITSRGVQAAGEQLLGYQPDRAGTLVLIGSQLLLLGMQLVILIAVIMSGLPLGLASLLAAVPMSGSVLLAVPWARALAIQLKLSTALLTELDDREKM